MLFRIITHIYQICIFKTDLDLLYIVLIIADIILHAVNNSKLRLKAKSDSTFPFIHTLDNNSTLHYRHNIFAIFGDKPNNHL